MNFFHQINKGQKNQQFNPQSKILLGVQQGKNVNDLFKNILLSSFNMTQDQFLGYLFNLLQEKPQLDILMDRKIFCDLKEQVQASSWSSDDRAKLITNLEDYIQTSVQISNYQGNQKDFNNKFESFGQKYGQKIQKLQAQLAMRNQWLLYTLDFLEQFSQYTFDIDNYQQVSRLVNGVKYLCIRDLTSIFYISSYFVKCCEELQKKGVKIQVIIEKLQKVGKRLKQQFSVLQANQKQKQYMKKQDQSSEYDRHLNFQAKYYEPYAFKLQGTVAEKQIQLDNQIMKIVQQGKEHHDLFKDIVYSCCIDNNGYNFKSNLKLKSKADKGPLHRVKQKLFKNQIQKIQSQIPESIKIQLNNCLTIQQRRKTQSKFTSGIMDRVLQQANEVPFSVTDILRGKCLFNKIAHINQAVTAIVNNIRIFQKSNSNIQLIQIDNRLKKITRDIVLKIKIGNVVTQFQLVIFFVQAQNQIHHKMYELGRSKIKSNVSLLFQWCEASVKKFMQSMNLYISRLKGQQKDKIKMKVQKLKEAIGKKQLVIQQTPEFKEFSANKINKAFQKFNKNFRLDQNLKVKKIINSINYYYERRQFKNILRYENHNGRNDSLDVKILMKIGNAYRQINDKANAAKFYDQGLKIAKQRDNCKSVQAEIFNQLGNLNVRSGKLQQALNFFKQSLAIKQQMKDDPQVDCAGCLSNIGMIYFYLNNHAEALDFFNRALQYQQKTKGRHNIGCGFTLNNIGMVYDKQGKYQQALDFYNQALYILETAKGKNSLDCASILNNIGTVYKNLGKDLQALDFYNQSLRIRQTFKGKDHIDCASSFNNIAGVYKSLQKNQQSLNYLKRCLQVRKKVLGNNHKDYASTLNNIGITYVSLKQFEKALEYLFQSLKIRQQLKNSGDISISLQAIGTAYQKWGKLQEALKYYKQAERIVENDKGKDNLTYSQIVCNIGNVHQKLEKNQQALDFYKQSIQIVEKIKGKNSIDYAQILKFIGSVHKKIKKYKQALDYYSQSQKITEKIKGKNSLINSQILNTIGSIHQNLGNKDEAQKFYKQSKSLTASIS